MDDVLYDEFKRVCQARGLTYTDGLERAIKRWLVEQKGDLEGELFLPALDNHLHVHIGHLENRLAALLAKNAQVTATALHLLLAVLAPDDPKLQQQLLQEARAAGNRTVNDPAARQVKRAAAAEAR